MRASYSTENKEEEGTRIMLSEKSVPDKRSPDGKSLLQRIGTSFTDSIGDIVFGMEDGTVSIFGLVFGVASSTTSSSAVLLAGATGAIAAAVSMMAGTFLDVESTNDQAKAKLAHEQAASVPVIPFALLPLGPARLVSLIVTAILLLLLGVGRGLVGHRNVVLTALETLGIATAAALAGFLIGKLVTR
jgi:VIT1/CCC1 family predicted Fe2+/Mn2+ transporter